MWLGSLAAGSAAVMVCKLKVCKMNFLYQHSERLGVGVSMLCVCVGDSWGGYEVCWGPTPGGL